MCYGAASTCVPAFRGAEVVTQARKYYRGTVGSGLMCYHREYNTAKGMGKSAQLEDPDQRSRSVSLYLMIYVPLRRKKKKKKK